LLAEALGATLVHQVVVAHQQDGCRVIAGLLAEATHHVEGGVDRDAGLERALTGKLDRGAVGHRIGERHAELDQVGTGAGQTLQDLVADVDIGIAGADIGHETGALVGLELGEASGDAAHGQIFMPSRSATANTSLSPRPQRFITSRLSLASAGASLVTWAKAWAGSSAGMMPSSLHSSWRAASASLSVADTYSTRPCSFSQECSGPMPG